MDEIVWAVNPKHDTLSSLVGYLSKYAQDFLRPAGIRCRLDLPTLRPGKCLAIHNRHMRFGDRLDGEDQVAAGQSSQHAAKIDGHVRGRPERVAADRAVPGDVPVCPNHG